jgi:hypothetical protein
LFLGRQFRERGHGLPQQFSHSPILAQQFWSAHGSLPLLLHPPKPLFEAQYLAALPRGEASLR